MQAAKQQPMLPFVRYNAEQAARHKRERDERRKAIRAHNARAKTVK